MRKIFNFLGFIAITLTMYCCKALMRRSVGLKATPFKLNSSKFFTNGPAKGVIIESEKVVYEGYRNMIRRDVLLPNGNKASFDIVTQKSPSSVVVFAWDTRSKTTTLVSEYHPGANCVMKGVVAGMYELDKHASPLQAAQYELEEEAQLQSKNWHSLLATPGTSAPFDKYSDNQFFPFLALDCAPVANARPMDAEECIEVHHNVSHQELLRLLHSGGLNVASSYAVLLGLRKLEDLGIEVC